MKNLIALPSTIGLAFALFSSPALARQYHHHYRHSHYHHHNRQHIARTHDGRPSAWCGWWMRQQVGGDPGSEYNLARNWAHFGHAVAAAIGAIVVWPHHVGKIVGGLPGHWVIQSGNDGHRVRTRERSVSGAIAFRE